MNASQVILRSNIECVERFIIFPVNQLVWTFDVAIPLVNSNNYTESKKQ